jgi:hypothetical protein
MVSYAESGHFSHPNPSVRYNTFIYPYLSYGAIVWADKNNSNLDSLFLTQKKIIRTCTNSVWLAHTNPLFTQLQTLKVRDIYIHQLATFMYRYNRELLPRHLINSLFNTNINSNTYYDTRQSADIRVPKTATMLATNTLNTQGAIIWNTLNSTIKKSPSMTIFKKKLKTHILGQYTTDVASNSYATVF